VGKSGVLEHKSDNMYETRKDRSKVTMGTYQRSFERYHPETSTPYGLLFPKIGGSQPHPKPKTPIAIISVTGKAMDFKFGHNICRLYPNKSPLNFLEKRERGRIQGLTKVFKNPLLSEERVKIGTSHFVRVHIHSTKHHYKFRKK